MQNIKALRLIVILLAIYLTGCAGKYAHELKFNAAEPLRVAVLPFVSIDSKGQIINEEGRLIVDNLGLISSEVEDSPAQIVRREVISELQKSNLNIISTAAIDIDLPHRGFADKTGGLDLEKLLATTAKELCTKALSCDAIMTGKIIRWDRSYYGLQSVNTVGIELNILSAKDNSIIFHSSAEDNESRGITKIPTGFSSILLEPIRGLDSEIIEDLSLRVVKKMLSPLLIEENNNATSSPPAIYAAAHDGNNRKISLEEPLIVIAFGSEKARGFFSIGNKVSKVPMIEVAPGHYYGEYIPLQGDQIKNEIVSVGLTDSSGRSTFYKSYGGAVSYAY